MDDAFGVWSRAFAFVFALAFDAGSFERWCARGGWTVEYSSLAVRDCEDDIGVGPRVENRARAVGGCARRP